ncbi:MAG: hypothetical protein MUO59_01940 [Actinobacteria bacterium]|nr:hypothetical protein [Actinomycetota bacterium]
MESNPDKCKDKKFEKLITKYLHPDERIALEMIVLDSDKKRAADFLSAFDLKIKDPDALLYCKKWLKIVERGEQGKLNIRLTGKGPSMDLK